MFITIRFIVISLFYDFILLIGKTKKVTEVRLKLEQTAFFENFTISWLQKTFTCVPFILQDN